MIRPGSFPYADGINQNVINTTDGFDLQGTILMEMHMNSLELHANTHFTNTLPTHYQLMNLSRRPQSVKSIDIQSFGLILSAPNLNLRVSIEQNNSPIWFQVSLYIVTRTQLDKKCVTMMTWF